MDSSTDARPSSELLPAPGDVRKQSPPKKEVENAAEIDPPQPQVSDRRPAAPGRRTVGVVSSAGEPVEGARVSPAPLFSGPGSSSLLLKTPASDTSIADGAFTWPSDEEGLPHPYLSITAEGHWAAATRFEDLPDSRRIVLQAAGHRSP